MQKKITLLFGIVIILVTLTNFVPAAVPEINDVKLLFGMFLVGMPLIVIHLATGAIGVIVATLTGYARRYLQIFGGLFALLAIAGFIGGNTILGLFDINLADNLLHTAFAAALLGAGFGLKD
jgi:hypothetical protein